MNRRLLAPAALAAALALAGCGKLGALDRPGPMFGKGNAAADAGGGQDTVRPVTTVDPRDRDRSTDLSPVRSLPIPGQGQNPTATAPQGVLPDPYANPQK